MFAGGPVDTPPHLYDILLELVSPHHSLVVICEREDLLKIQLHQWPSWLQQGSTSTVRAFLAMLYPPAESRGDYGPAPT